MSQKDHFLTESQIAALVGPRTREVMDAFLAQGPMSIPVLQGVLQMSSKTIYYQVAKLVDVGLLLSSGGDPVVYAAVADKLRMPAGYQGARYERLTARMVGAGLRRAIRRFEQVAQAAPVDPTLIDDQYYLKGDGQANPGTSSGVSPGTAEPCFEILRRGGATRFLRVRSESPS